VKVERRRTSPPCLEGGKNGKSEEKEKKTESEREKEGFNMNLW
jgi:hypothetical protein